MTGKTVNWFSSGGILKVRSEDNNLLINIGGEITNIPLEENTLKNITESQHVEYFMTIARQVLLNDTIFVGDVDNYEDNPLTLKFRDLKISIEFGVDDDYHYVGPEKYRFLESQLINYLDYYEYEKRYYGRESDFSSEFLYLAMMIDKILLDYV